MIYNYLINISISDIKAIEIKENVETFLIQLAKTFEFNIIDSVSYKFSPQGYTSILLLSESHLSIHTWPENKFGCIDILTCKDKLDINFIEKIINNNMLGIKCLKITEIERTVANNV